MSLLFILSFSHDTKIVSNNKRLHFFFLTLNFTTHDCMFVYGLSRPVMAFNDFLLVFHIYI